MTSQPPSNNTSSQKQQNGATHQQPFQDHSSSQEKQVEPSQEMPVKRQLPRRASRGVRPSVSAEQKEQDDRLYNQLFGQNLSEDEKERGEDDADWEEPKGPKLLENYNLNFYHFNYGRGYHYFFDLTTFPRLSEQSLPIAHQNSELLSNEKPLHISDNHLGAQRLHLQSPSYADDFDNRFGSTYSKDEVEEFKGTKLKHLINRRYFGLPSIETTHSNKKSHDKNICHPYLFDNEDHKYHNSRVITKINYVLKNMDKLLQHNKLSQYSEFRRDPLLQEIIAIAAQHEQSPQQRAHKISQILAQRKKTVEERMKNSEGHIFEEDFRFYHFSNDQQFHMMAEKKQRRLNTKNIFQTIFQNVVKISNFLTSENNGDESQTVSEKSIKMKLQTIFHHKGWLEYFNSDDEYFTHKDSTAKQNQHEKSSQKDLAIEKRHYDIFSSNMKRKLQGLPIFTRMVQQRQELVKAPIFTFNFINCNQGKLQHSVFKYADILLKAKFMDDDEAALYVYKNFVRKLFHNRNIYEQCSPFKPMLKSDYMTLMLNKIKAVREFFEKEFLSRKDMAPIEYPHLDKLVQIEKLKQQFSEGAESSQTAIPLLQCSDNKVCIGLKDLMLLLIYQNILKGIHFIASYLERDPEMIHLMSASSPYHDNHGQTYEKYHMELSSIIKAEEFYSLIKNIDRFNSVLLDNTEQTALKHGTFVDFFGTQQQQGDVQSDHGHQTRRQFMFRYSEQYTVGYVWIETTDGNGNRDDGWETERSSSEESYIQDVRENRQHKDECLGAADGESQKQEQFKQFGSESVKKVKKE